jgi:hypothetical protein
MTTEKLRAAILAQMKRHGMFATKCDHEQYEDCCPICSRDKTISALQNEIAELKQKLETEQTRDFGDTDLAEVIDSCIDQLEEATAEIPDCLLPDALNEGVNW